MAESTLDLISMADIAQLAGQSRATVGNWKSRNLDFPPERGRGSRGPLYDRAEVVAWLQATNRLKPQETTPLRPQEVPRIWTIISQFKGEVETDKALRVYLLVLALMSRCTPAEWQEICHAPAIERDKAVRAAVQAHFPFAEERLLRADLPMEFVLSVVSAMSYHGQDQLAATTDAFLDESAKLLGI